MIIFVKICNPLIESGQLVRNDSSTQQPIHKAANIASMAIKLDSMQDNNQE